MNRCFELAEKGRGKVRSNPMVGAVLVHSDTIVSEGYHPYYGGPHAEVECLSGLANTDLLADSILYISLEPCNFYGKTPPCTELIVHNGIRKIVVGSADFNPRVRNNGMDYLRSHGIEIFNLNWEKRQRELNIIFFINQVKEQPYFIGKLAISKDGRIGRLGEKIKITAPEIDVLTHKSRSEVDAIMVGGRTWVNDQPQLNVREVASTFQPDIIVWQREKNEVKHTSDGRAIHFLNEGSLSNLSATIWELGYKSILVEGGGEVFDRFLQARMFHEIRTIKNEKMEVGEGILAPAIEEKSYPLKLKKMYNNHIINTYFKNDLFTS